MHQNQCTGFRILLIRFVFTRVYENRKKGANDYCERSKGGRVMRNFFTRLRVCEDEILILSILVYTLFSRMFDLMQPPVVKHSIAVA